MRRPDSMSMLNMLALAAAGILAYLTSSTASPVVGSGVATTAAVIVWLGSFLYVRNLLVGSRPG